VTYPKLKSNKISKVIEEKENIPCPQKTKIEYPPLSFKQEKQT